MSAEVAHDSFESVLWWILRTQHFMPLSTHALLHAQFKSVSALNAELVGSLLIYRDGVQRRIVEIRQRTPESQTLGAKVSNWITRSILIQTLLSPPEPANVDELKMALTTYLNAEAERQGESNFDFTSPLETVIARLASSNTVADIFDALQMPAPEDCLDILC